MLIAAVLCAVLFTGPAVGGGKRKDKPIEVLTFNTGLEPNIVGNYTDRRQRIGEAIHEVNADVVCLQSVFFYDDMMTILNNNTQYPYAMSSMHVDGALPSPSIAFPCKNASVEAMLQCMVTNCSVMTSKEDSFVCLLSRCNFLDTFSQECASCIIYANGPDLFKRCFEPDIKNNMLIDGLLLLSKYPLKEPEVVRYHDTNSTLLFIRSYIKAKIAGLGTVMCTGLTKNITGTHGYLEKKNYAEIHRAETETLVNAFGVGNRGIITGDLNMGPTIPKRGIHGDNPDSYKFIRRRGFRQTYRKMDKDCTLCDDNILVKFQRKGIIDQILYRKLRLFKSKDFYRSVPNNIPWDPLFNHSASLNSVSLRSDAIAIRNYTSSITEQFRMAVVALRGHRNVAKFSDQMRVLDQTSSDGIPLSHHYGFLAKVKRGSKD